MPDEQDRGGSSPFAVIGNLVTPNLEKIAEQARALVVLAAIVAVAALGLLVAVDDQAVRLAGLTVFLTLMLLTTVLLYRISKASTGGSEDSDHVTVAAALSSVNGHWWQLIDNDDSPGLSLIDVSLSVLPTRHHISGTKYTPDGKVDATWWTVAVGLVAIDPVRVLYYWQGSYPGHPGNVSGIGFLDFLPASEAKFESGTGWFTTGDVDNADFSTVSTVQLRRAAPEDKAVVDEAGAGRIELIRRRHSGWVAE